MKAENGTGFSVHDAHQIAIHEAGHAVAYARLFPGRPILTATIIPDYDDAAAGYVQHLDDHSFVAASASDDEADDHFERAATFYLAGYAALLAAGESEKVALVGCESDFEQAGDRVDTAKVAALALMAEPANRQAVALVASKLLEWKTLDSDHIAVLIDLADGECTQAEYVEFLALSG